MPHDYDGLAQIKQAVPKPCIFRVSRAPKGGKLVPSDAPGFGMDLKDEYLIPWIS